MRSLTLVLLCWSICLGYNYGQSNTSKSKTYFTKQINNPIEIDGKLNDEAWEKVKWGKGFKQSEPEPDTKPSFATQFKILYDESYLYVGFRCFDDQPELITGAITPRDFFDGDWVEINIDSDFDRKEAYSFTITAVGIRGDEYIKNADNWYNDWNPAWTAQTQIDKQGWTAEVQIPLAELNITKALPQWGIQVNRSMGRGDESASWIYIPEESGEWVEQFGLLKGIEQMPIQQPTSWELNSKISGKHCQEDLNILHTTLAATYPSLDQFRSKAFMNQVHEELIKKSKEGMNISSFAKEVRSYLSLIGDGHFSIDFPKYYDRLFQEKVKRLPLKLLIGGEGAYIEENYSSSDLLEEGTKVIAIGGQPMEQIVQKMLGWICSDGFNNTGRYHVLSEDFGFFYALMVGDRDQIALEIIRPESKQVESTTVSLLAKEAIEELRQKKYPDQEQDDFQLEFKSDLAIMTITTFNNPYSFKNFVDKAFANIKTAKVNKLILDFRNNGGGQETNAIYLYSYLTDQPFRYYDGYEISIGPDQKDIEGIDYYKSFENIQFLATISGSDKQSGFNIKDYQAARLIDPDQLQEPKSDPFLGEVLVLINGGSFSATSELCAVMHRDQRAEFIGQETGGGYHGNTSGLFGDLVLPNSKIKIRVPLIKYVSAVSETKAEFGRGLVPDYVVKENQIDLIKGNDPIMDLALKLMNAN